MKSKLSPTWVLAAGQAGHLHLSTPELTPGMMGKGQERLAAISTEGFPWTSHWILLQTLGMLAGIVSGEVEILSPEILPRLLYSKNGSLPIVSRGTSTSL